MGICCSVPLVCHTDTSVRKIALKLPHGSLGVSLDTRQFKSIDMNEWLTHLYANTTWSGWFCYNDELPESPHTTRGHCKGILAWNDTRISWLIHSVPKYPQLFTGSAISPISKSELIYGQSFLYIEQSRAAVNLADVVRQILWMKPNLFHVHNIPTVVPYAGLPEIKTLRWSNTMTHLAKSPDHDTDFIGTELAKIEPGSWHEESWKRGSEYPPVKNLTSIHTLCVNNTTYTSSQDHSKWAVSPSRLWMGDLNHMRSQKKRGGGGIVIQDHRLAAIFSGFIKVQN